MPYRRMRLVVWLMLGTALIARGISYGANLHLVVFADTTDSAIGADRDLERAGNWGKLIADQTGLTLRLRTLPGRNLSESAARSVLQGLSPNPEDVVYFIYTGHGVNLGDSHWPTFTFSNGDLFGFEEVLATLELKPQRLLILMADCCNNIVHVGRVTPDPFESAQNALTTVNFQSLFLDFRGTIAASSSSPGQPSLAISGEGGLFLNIFMDDFLTSAGRVPGLAWQHVLATTADDVQKFAAEFGETQEPQFTINTEQVAADPPDPAPGGEPDPADFGASPAPMCGSAGSVLLATGMCLWALRRKPR